jgi:hypothetical protein
VVLCELLRRILSSNALEDCVELDLVGLESVEPCLLFLPPGWSSWKFVTSYTSSLTMISRSVGLLWEETSSFEKTWDMVKEVTLDLRRGGRKELEDRERGKRMGVVDRLSTNDQ